MTGLTQVDLMTEFHYSPESGVFTQVGYNRKRPIGTVVGTINAHGYLACKIKGVGYTLHRLAFLYMTGSLPEFPLVTDHINGVRTDNRWTNLRLATRGQNAKNALNRKDNSTGIKGVTMSIRNGKRRFDAAIQADSVTYSKSMTNLLNTSEEDRRILTELIRWLDTTRENLHGVFANDGMRGSSLLGSTSLSSSETTEGVLPCQQ